MQRPWLALAFTFWLGSLAPLLALVLGLATALLALRRLPALALAGTALAAGGGLGLAEARFLAERPAAPEDLTATVRRVERKGDRFYFELSPDAAPAWGIRAQQAHRPPGLAAGARVRVLGTLSPFDPADNPGGFDGEAWAARRHLAWRAHGEVLLLAPAGAPAEGLQAMRDEAWRRLQALERPFGAGVLAGLLLGDRAAMPPDAERAFLESGTAHLLSVSGTHVGGVAALLIFGLGRLGRRLHLVHPELPALLLAVPITVLFVLLAQAPLAAARTGVMVTLYLLGRALGRTPDPLNLLGFAALWALCEAPSTASEPAFQLSFGAVLALLTLTGGATGLRGLVVASFVSFVATAPLQAWHFGTFCPISLPANLLLIPLTSLVLVPLGLVGLVVAPWTTLPLEWAAAGSEFLAAMAEIFSGFMGMWTVGAHGAAWLAAPLIVLIGLRMGRWRAALVPAGAAIGLTFWWAPPSHTVDFVAVGQGDAVVVRSGGQVLLVDTGPPTGTPALLGYLRCEGIGRIDRVIISHAHPDHDGGLEALAGELPIGEVWTHGRPLTSRHWRGIRAALGNAPVRAASLGSHPMGALTVEVLLTDAPADLEENDASVALRVRGAGGAVLLTGDLEAAGEARLLAVLPPAAEPTVLKAPHHGSKTSSSEALIDAVRPAAVVFTTGRRNRFGFPHEVVKARYAARNVPTWDTAADGRVRVHLGSMAIEGMRRSQVSLENQEVE